MKINCIIGIDPGAAGGIVCWRIGAKPEAIPMPKDLLKLRDWLEYVKSICCPIVFLEKLSVRPDDMVGGKMFRVQKMLANFEQLKTIISICEIPFCMVHPMRWQNVLKLRIKQKGFHEEKADRKRRFRDIAGKLYPDIKATLWNADATLIMHFGRYVLQNDPDWVLNNLPDDMQKGLF